MNWILLGIGVALLVLVALDALWTTLWLNGGAGPVTTAMSRLGWRLARAICGEHHRCLGLYGPLLLVGTLLMWVGLLFAGWACVFAADDQAVLVSKTKAPAELAGRLYFTGFTVFTLGVGDYVPAQGPWQLVTIVATASGLLLITLVITYVMRVVSAVVDQRTFASQVSALGEQPAAIAMAGWNGDSFRDLDLPLNTLSQSLTQLAEQTRAYPILAFYHPDQARRSPRLALARLDEALSLLALGVPAERRPGRAVLTSARSAVDGYLQSQQALHMIGDAETPPPPALAALREAGVPTLEEAEFARAIASLVERRRSLRALVAHEGWRWPG